MASIKELEDLRKLRCAWDRAGHGGVTWLVAVDDESALHVFCMSQKNKETIENASDQLAATLNAATGRPMLVTRVRAHVVDSPTLILARQMSELESLLVEAS